MLFGVTRWHIRLRIRKPLVVGSNPTAGSIDTVSISRLFESSSRPRVQL